MRIAYLTKVGHVEVREFKTPIPGEYEILLHVKAAGICGSDIHAFHGTHPFRKPPMTLGHEVSGVVVAVGSEVTRIQVGDRVTVEPQQFCEHCSMCKIGLFNLCLSRKTPGVGGWLGTFAEFFVAPEKQAYILPESLDYDLGMLAEPLAVGVHAIRIAGVENGKKVAVLGTGPIGLLAAVAAQEAGASQIYCTDINRFRINMAQDFGIHAINVNDTSAQDIITANTEGGCDIVFVTVSSHVILDQALQLVRRGGKIIVISVFGEKIPFDISLVQLHEIEVKGSMVYTPDDFKKALQIIEKRQGELKRTVTHHVGLDNVNEAFHMLHNPQNDAVKIIVNP